MADANTVSRPESVVAHHVDGRVTKGQTDDFSPARPTFTLIPLDGADYSEWKHFEVPRLCLPVAVKFTDGEVMVGAQLPLTTDYGFLLFPADRGSNNERVFVVSAAVTIVEHVPD